MLSAACLVTIGLLPAPVAAAYGVDIEDRTAARSRTYTAYTNDSGTIFEINFTTLFHGEKRRIRGRLQVSVPSTASDPMVVARHAIRCGRADEKYSDQVYGVRNILRGQTYVQTPRYTFTAGSPGQYRCFLWVGSGRPRPSDVRQSSNYFRVGWDSSLHATEPIRSAAEQHFTPKEPSHLLHRGQASDENALAWTAPLFTDSFSASGDAYVTTCTSIGGSMDPVTKKHACEGYTKVYGSKISTRLVVGQQRADGNGYCALHYFPSQKGRQTYITKDIHHVVVFNSGTVPIRKDNGCSRKFTVKVMIKNVDGSAVMVHRQGTITSAIPPS